jgi:hypothetical protein
MEVGLAVVKLFTAAVTKVATAATTALMAAGASASVAGFVGNVILSAGTFGVWGTGVAKVVGGLIAANALSALMRAVTPKPEINDGGRQVNFVPDPNAPRPLALGRIGVPGIPIHATTHGTGSRNNAFLTYFLAVSAFGPVQAYERFDLSGVQMEQSAYAARTQLLFKNGHWDQTAFTFPVGREIPEWDADHRGSGIAMAAWTSEYDPNVFAGGLPEPRVVFQGAADVRQPADDALGYSDNPAALAWTFLTSGFASPNGAIRIGSPIPMTDDHLIREDFAYWATVCTNRNWKAAGFYTDKDDPIAILRTLLQAGGAELALKGGRLGVCVRAPGTVVGTLRETHLANGPPQRQPFADRTSRPTRVVPRHLSEEAQWDYAHANPVGNVNWLAQDRGVPRTLDLDMPAVPQSAQARQLAYYFGHDLRAEVVTVPVKASTAAWQAGSYISVNLTEFGINWPNAVIVENTATAMAAGTMILRREDSDVHTLAMGFGNATDPPQEVTQTPVSAFPPPALGSITVGSVLLNNGAGLQVPALQTAVSVLDALVESVEMRMRPAGSATWWDVQVLTGNGADSPTSTRVFRREVRDLLANVSYELQFRHVAYTGRRSDWSVTVTAATGAYQLPVAAIPAFNTSVENRVNQIIDDASALAGSPTSLATLASAFANRNEEIRLAVGLAADLSARIFGAEDSAVRRSTTESELRVATSGNLVRNPLFVTSRNDPPPVPPATPTPTFQIVDWSGSAGLAVGESSGRRFLRLGGTGFQFAQSSPIPVSAGQTYSASAELFAGSVASGPPNTVYAYISFYSDALGTVLLNGTGAPALVGTVTSADWTRVVRETPGPQSQIVTSAIVVPAGAQTARYLFDNRHSTGGSGGPFPAVPNVGFAEPTFNRGSRVARFSDDRAESAFALRMGDYEIVAGGSLGTAFTRITNVEAAFNTPGTGALARLSAIENLTLTSTLALAQRMQELATARTQVNGIDATTLSARLTNDLATFVDGQTVSAAEAALRLTAAREGPNRIPNGGLGGMETGTTPSGFEDRIPAQNGSNQRLVGWRRSPGGILANTGWEWEPVTNGFGTLVMYSPADGTYFATSPIGPAQPGVTHSGSLEVQMSGFSSGTVRFWIEWLNSANAVIGQTGFSASATGAGGRIVLEGVVSPAGTAGVRMVVQGDFTSAGGFRFVRVARSKVNPGATATRWSDDATIAQAFNVSNRADLLAATAETTLAVLGPVTGGAGVLTRSQAMINMRDRVAIATAGWLTRVSAGPNYAEVALAALDNNGAGAGVIDIAANAIRLINPVGGARITVLNVTDGFAFFQTPVNFATAGARVTVGSAAGKDFVFWFGPSNIDPPDQTRANSYFTFGTDGELRKGTSIFQPGTVGAKGNRTSNNVGTSGAVTEVASVTITDAPAGKVRFPFTQYVCRTGTGDGTFRVRITRQLGSGTPTDFAISNSEVLIVGGTPQIGVDFSEFFAALDQPTTSGTVTYRMFLDRVAGTGDVLTSTCVLDVEQWPN